MTTESTILGSLVVFLTSLVLARTILYKVLQILLIYLRVPWKNSKGERMPGELPELPFGHFHKVNFFGRQLSIKYGPIYYIWHCFTPVVILSDAKAIRSFYTDHYSHEREPDFTCLGSVFKGVLGRCLATSCGKEELRRCRGPFEKYFSADAIAGNLQVIGRECSTFMKTLPVGQPISLRERKLQDVTLRVMVHVVYGGEVLEKNIDQVVRLDSMLQNVVDLINVGTTRLPFYSLLPTKPNQRIHSFNEAWRNFNRFLFKEYKEGRLSSDDGLFFATMEQLETHAIEIEEEELFQSVNEILLLNIDVSFAATSFALADLAQHQMVQDKVRNEIDEVLQGRDPSTCADLDKMLPYMEIVLKESARMHPALALSLPEKTVKPSTQLGNYQIPKGTPICVDTFSLNFSETYWKNPEEFNPERFANGQHPIPGSFFRFGMGPRKCLGYRYALAISRIVVASFIQKYTLQLSDCGSAPKINTAGMAFFTPYICPDIVLNNR